MTSVSTAPAIGPIRTLIDQNQHGPPHESDFQYGDYILWHFKSLTSLRLIFLCSLMPATTGQENPKGEPTILVHSKIHQLSYLQCNEQKVSPPEIIKVG